MQTVFLTGATGQTGSYFCEYLLDKGFKVVAGVRRTSQEILNNLQNCINNTNFKITPFDLTDACSITTAIKQEKPDYFLNLGAATFVADSWNSPALHMQTNAVSLIHILEAIRNYCPSCRVLSMGSSEQYGDVKYSPQDEKHIDSPRSIYGVSKVAAKFICKVYRESYGMYIVHAISFNKESPRRQKYFITRKITSGIADIFKSLKNSNPVTAIELGNIDSKRDWSHSKDFVEGLWRAVNQEDYNEQLKNKLFDKFPPDSQEWTWGDRVGVNYWLSKHLQEYLFASGETHTVREFIELAFKYSPVNSFFTNSKFYWRGSGLDEQYVLEKENGETIILITINPKFFRPADVDLLLGDSSKARRELKWTPQYNFHQLVKEMVDFDCKRL